MPHPWAFPQKISPTAELLTETGDVLLAEILTRRGQTEPGLVRAFLNPLAYSPASPTELPGLAAASARLEQAIEKQEFICVWGDFDVDGQTATAILVSALRLLGAKVGFHIPIRQTESHGIQLQALKNELNRLPLSVLLTCDTGISAHESIAYAQSVGVDTLITDHHSIPQKLPDAVSVVNPRFLSPEHPLGQLSGAGTAFKLAQHLLTMHGVGCDFLYDLAALGTIADLVPLVGENRYIAQRGLEYLAQSQRPGLQALYELAEIKNASINEELVTFLLAPRLNAVGRLADANVMVDFFLTTDTAQARFLAAQCEGLNAKRKWLCDQVYDAAIEQINQSNALKNAPVLVLNHPTWPAGVLGIIASRLVERFQKPALMISSPPGELARGSARSLAGFDVTRLLTDCSDYLINYGGHPMAAGFALLADTIPSFQTQVMRVAQGMTFSPPEPPAADAVMPFSDLSFAQVKQCERLAPFGPGNPPIMLIAENVHIVSVKTVGKNNEHLKLVIANANDNPFDVLWWNGRKDLLPPKNFDLAYSPRTTTFQGAEQLNFVWLMAHSSEVPVLNTRKVSVLDLRGQPLKDETDLQIWYEGRRSDAFSGCNRYQLKSMPRLALAACPPGPDELRLILHASRAEEVVLFFPTPDPEKSTNFLRHLSGLIKYAIHHHQGIVSLADLAAATGHRTKTIGLGLDWLVQMGHIKIEHHIDDGYVLKLGDRQVLQDVQKTENDLSAMLDETNAYRQHLHTLSCEEWADLLTHMRRTDANF
ncbi:MAG TPA: single-stranded-DNA-specific exonuclease RecJ [Anaerolineaceae bacterium]|nr:single-stranded-DNA-specific exonuclease RecJ [Anaerolineaceae bacterium]HPN51724.1 single-stranded-DNA-specific exonuclease RecJ [Anaerolineaceae bacterium]